MPSSSNTIGLAEAERICAVREITFYAAPPHDHAKGLLGWVRFVVAPGFAVRSVALRCRTDGSTYLAYPSERHGSKVMGHYFCPIDDRVRQAVEVQVFAALPSVRKGLSA